MSIIKRGLLLVLAAAIFLGGWFTQGGTIASASGGTPTPTPGKRTVQLKIPYTQYWWWLLRWQNNQVTCTFSVEHPGTPTNEEIQAFCDSALYEEWKVTPPCQIAKVDQLSQCPGLYLHHISSKDGTRQIIVDLPTPRVWITLDGCTAEPPQNHCSSMPNLLFIGEEPLPNEMIIRLQGLINEQPFSCPGNQCSIPLHPTGMEGQTVEFWADSSFGDSSKRFTAQVRLVPWGDFMNPEERSKDLSTYYVDIISSQWRGARQASCSEVWQVFPDVGGPPVWLTSPQATSDLETSIPYYLLASVLIQNGIVKADHCPNGGIQSPRVANACGIEAAMPALIQWQNSFDEEILKVSQETGVPAQLLKNVFSRESQFWPGIYKSYKEAGLGQLTENGADTILLWNPNFYQQFCPLVLDQYNCSKNFDQLDEGARNILKGALVRQVNAACKDCPSGIDLTQANSSVRIFAESMTANCEQVGQILYNVTQQSPGAVTTFGELWRFTLANYDAGSGCLYNAVERAVRQKEPLDWAHVSPYLEPACQGAIDYVNDISYVRRATPTATPWLPFGTPQPLPTVFRPSITPTPSNVPPLRSPTPSPTPSQTPTPSGSATPTHTPAGTATVTPTPAAAASATPTPTPSATPTH